MMTLVLAPDPSNHNRPLRPSSVVCWDVSAALPGGPSSQDREICPLRPSLVVRDLSLFGRSSGEPVRSLSRWQAVARLDQTAY